MPEAGRQYWYTTWITSLDNVDHVVTDEENVVCAREKRGTRRAVCGVEFRPGPMDAPPGWTCRACQEICRINARAHRAEKLTTESRKRARRSPRQRVTSRLLRRAGQ